MTREEVDNALNKLQEIREQGFAIDELLVQGPSNKKVQHGQIADASLKVGKKLRRRIGHERARKSVEFANAFTAKQWMQVMDLCYKHSFAPEFGTLVRLIPLKPRERNQLLKEVLVKKWTKADLDAELELRKPSGSKVDEQRRGRPPKAAKSLRALKGQAAIDARRWTHIVDLLEHDDAAFKLTKSQQKDLSALSEHLRKISNW